MSIEVPIPIDDDGFLRRQCPACERQFKWFPGATDERPDDAVDPDVYVCPYCAEPAPPDQWYTTEQVEYLGQVGAAALSDVIDQELGQFPTASGGFIEMSIERTGSVDTPVAPAEPNDMVMVASPCHSYEPVKIDQTWTDPLHCLVCGATYRL